MSDTTITINKGSDATFTVSWTDSSGSIFDLTGYTVSLYDASSTVLSSQLSLAITNATSGQITGTLTWSDDLGTGSTLSFRILVTKTLRKTSQKIKLNII